MCGCACQRVRADSLAHMDRVVISDGQVTRPANWWTPTVHALLLHLRTTGFVGVPEPRQLTETTETLSCISGDSGADGWARIVPDEGLRAFARFLRAYHHATGGFVMPPDGRWAFTDRAAQPGEVICHNDFGPWNVVWDGLRPVGLIDFDFAAPGDPILDIAYALEYSAPFRSDEDALQWHRFSAPPDRRHRIAVFADAYGLGSSHGLVDAVISRQRLDVANVQAIAAAGVEPQVTWVKQGYLDELGRRIAWSQDNRHLLE